MSVRSLELRPEVEEELASAAAYYGDLGSALCAAFEIEFKRAVGFILENPKACAIIDSIGARRHSLQRFPYSIYYTHEGDSIEIIAVAHHRRRPGYWLDRLQDD